MNLISSRFSRRFVWGRQTQHCKHAIKSSSSPSPNVPSIWQRSFSKASAVASSSCGSSSPGGTESGLGRSDRQLSEEHSSAAPCCCLYRWCSTRNCSSGRREVAIGEVRDEQGREDVNEGKIKLVKSKELTGREREDNRGESGFGRNSGVKVESQKRELIGDMEGERGQARKRKWCEMKGASGREEGL